MRCDFEARMVGRTLFYPALKLRIVLARSKEMGDLNFSMAIEHDPQIDPARLLVLPSPEEQQRLRRIPLLAALADQPIPFRSANSTHIAAIHLRMVSSDGHADIVVTDSDRALRSTLDTLSLRLPAKRAPDWIVDALSRHFAEFDPGEIDMTWQAKDASRARLVLPARLAVLFGRPAVRGDSCRVLAEKPLD